MFHESTWGSVMSSIPIADGTDHQRWARLAGSWVQDAAVGVVVVAVEVDRARAQQGTDDRECLGEPADAMVVGEAERVVSRPIPSGAEAENETSTGDRVDGRRLLGQHRRRVEAGRRHERAERIVEVDAAIAASDVQTSHGPRSSTSNSYSR